MEENKDGGNGKLEKQKPPEIAEEKIVVLKICIGKVSKRIEVEGLLGNKTLCYHAIAEAIKTITDFNPSPIIQAPRGFIPRLRGFLNKH